MQNFKKTTTHITAKAFIDFKPAELRIVKDWLIVYHAKNPISNKLERFRLRVPVLKNVKEQKNTARNKTSDEVVKNSNFKF